MNEKETGAGFPVGIIGGVLVCFLLAGGAYYFFSRTGTVAQPGEEGKEIASSFLDQVRENKWDAAWDQTGPEFRSYMGKETFKNFVRKNPALKEKAEFKGLSKTTVNGLERVKFDFQSSKSAKKIEIVLAPDQGRFKVEHFHLE